MLCAAACRSDLEPVARLDLTVLRPPQDTLLFAMRFAARRCTDAAGALLEGDDGASGVLVLLRPGDAALPGDYDIRSPTESVATRHARVAVRYQADGVARSLALDHGTVRLDAAAGMWSGAVEGGGIEVAGGTRPNVSATFSAVAEPADSTSCGARS